jgi:hypothetical protein
LALDAGEGKLHGDAGGEKNISTPSNTMKPDSLVVQPVTQSLYWLRYLYTR